MHGRKVNSEGLHTTFVSAIQTSEEAMSTFSQGQRERPVRSKDTTGNVFRPVEQKPKVPAHQIIVRRLIVGRTVDINVAWEQKKGVERGKAVSEALNDVHHGSPHPALEKLGIPGHQQEIHSSYRLFLSNLRDILLLDVLCHP